MKTGRTNEFKSTNERTPILLLPADGAGVGAGRSAGVLVSSEVESPDPIAANSFYVCIPRVGKTDRCDQRTGHGARAGLRAWCANPVPEISSSHRFGDRDL